MVQDEDFKWSMLKLETVNKYFRVFTRNFYWRVPNTKRVVWSVWCSQSSEYYRTFIHQAKKRCLKGKEKKRIPGFDENNMAKFVMYWARSDVQEAG